MEETEDDLFVAEQKDSTWGFMLIVWGVLLAAAGVWAYALYKAGKWLCTLASTLFLVILMPNIAFASTTGVNAPIPTIAWCVFVAIAVFALIAYWYRKHTEYKTKEALYRIERELNRTMLQDLFQQNSLVRSKRQSRKYFSANKVRSKIKPHGRYTNI